MSERRTCVIYFFTVYRRFCYPTVIITQYYIAVVVVVVIFFTTETRKNKGGGVEHVFKNACEIRRSLSASVLFKPTSDLDRAENGLK